MNNLKIILFLVLAAIAKAVAYRIIYIGDLIAFYLTFAAFSQILATAKGANFYKYFGDISVIAVLSYVITWIYSFGLKIVLSFYYTVSLLRFIIAGSIFIGYCILGLTLLTIIVLSIEITTFSHQDFFWPIKKACNEFNKNKLIAILSSSPLGIMLFAPYYWQINSLDALGGNWIAFIFYLICYCLLFIIAFYFAKSYWRLEDNQPVSQEQSPAIINDADARKTMKSNAWCNLNYSLAFICLILSPVLTIYIYLLGIGSIGQTMSSTIMMVSWFVWLILATIYFIIKRTKSYVAMIVVYLPLIAFMYSFISQLFLTKT